MRQTGFSKKVVAAIIARDEGCCFRCGGYVLHGERGRDWSLQHRRARGMGGSRRPDTDSVQNGILLCGSATTGCHGWVESNRIEAIENGWAVPQHGDPLQVAVVHWRDGTIHLHSNGFTSSRPEVTV